MPSEVSVSCVGGVVVVILCAFGSIIIIREVNSDKRSYSLPR